MLRRTCRVGGREIVYRGNKCGGYRELLLFYSSFRSAKSDSYERGDRYVVLEFDKNEVLIDALGGDLASPTWMFRAHLYVSPCLRPTELSLTCSIIVTYSDVSRVSDVSISAYLRTSPLVPGQSRNDMGNDLFLGGVKFQPVFDANKQTDQWFRATSGSGEFHIQVVYKPSTVSGSSSPQILIKLGD